MNTNKHTNNSISIIMELFKPKNNIMLELKYKISSVILMILICFSHLSYAGTNTGLYGDDYYAGPFPIGFTFNHYGNNFTEFYVSTNGLIQFTNPTSAYTNSCLPSYNNTLYVFWDDLRTDVSGQPTGTIQYETQGEAPNRKLIVQWTNQYFYSSDLPMGTFQAILYEGSNQIKYQYRYLIDDRSKGNSATIGIQGTNSNFEQIGCNTANAIAPEQAILFTPNADFSDYNVDTNGYYEFIDISGLTPEAPKPIGRYTNQAPTWSWQKINTINTYEIDIQDPAGNSIHNEILGDVDNFTFAEGLLEGNSYHARIRGSINNGGTWEMWSALSSLTTVDTTKPTIQLDKFFRISADSVKVTFTTTDNLSGLATGHLQIATDSNFTHLLIDQDINVNTNNYQINGLTTTDVLYTRINVIDNAGNESGYSDPLQILVTPPVIVQPVSNSKVNKSTITVMGSAETAGSVQLYLDATAIASPITVDNTGYFTTDINLTNEGNHKLTATLQNNFGTSEPSNPVPFNFVLPTPKATITIPANGQEISAPIDIQVNATDELGIATVEIYIDGTLFTTLTELPYQTNWQVTSAQNGKHTIQATVTNTSGKSIVTTNQVIINVEPPAPPPTIYTGKVTSITPTTSYGPQPITIKGQAIYRADSSIVANAPLKLVLTVDGFERKITLVTDDTGNFSYNFIPQDSDTGIYQVAILHPNETTATVQGSFAINRIKFNLAGYNLKAARNITTPISINATASTGATALHWIARAEDQPSGSLPQGITIDGGTGIDIAAGKTATTTIEFTADDTASETGTIFLVALADDSAELVRGKLSINYQLSLAMPSLYANPTYLQTGLQQQSSITKNINIGNRGLTDAENVQVELLDEQGNQAPNWIFLATEKALGTISVDETVPVQLIAQPDNSVADGIYRFTIKITANNNATGTIPVAISVTQSGQGTARFDVADIYTATLDDNGQPIPGVKGATIKLQNEAVLTEEYTVTTDEQGIASLDQLPSGVYRYRASAANHMDASGRVVIRPDTTTNQHIFLEYQTINIEFSVTETTIQDIYDITLNATFNTQVPAPVVVIEPLSINLAGMQIGEEKTGQITITNYGLVQADNLVFNPPKTDNHFKYEFFGEVPTVLAPKSRIVIPYRVTALDGSQTKRLDTKATILQSTLLKMPRDASNCSSYSAGYGAKYQSDCSSGDISYGNSSGSFYKLTGSNCSGTPSGWSGGFGGSWGGGSWGGGSLSSPSPYPLTSGCTPDCTGDCCDTGGAGAANE